jgi:single-strand DNA-binding protein
MVNKVILIGRLGGDPEMRHLESGVAVARFSLATNKSYKDKDGNFQDLTEWHNIIVWREGAERAEKQLKKGMLAYVEGEINYRKYTDKDNIERMTTDITALTFRRLEKGEGSGENRFPSTEPAAMAARSTSVPETTPSNNESAAEGDDLPF